ncbi:MAG: response regulator [Clostridiales bacterium]|nr:response regulator [Clostridiales bacterium]
MDRFISANEYKRRVMIVDDEEINRLMLGNILENEYEVVYANNGQEAWDLLNGEEKDISLLLLDLLMPVMDGFELITKLKEDDELKRIPVIVMTSEK